MPSFSLFLTFLAATALFAFIPGPAMLYAAAQTLARGRRSGLMAALGIHLGGYVHIAAAAAGLSMLFHAVPVLYTMVKLAGAAYLIWLGISMFRSKGQQEAGAHCEPKSAGRAFLESIAVEVLNPKTALFFMAFLPQFVDASAAFPVWLQLMLLGAIVNLMFSLADIVAVVLANLVTTRLRSSTAVQRLIRRAGGTILVGLGVNLALQRG
jgi:threonine/homoserine/homoserine lactone efflux protein